MSLPSKFWYAWAIFKTETVSENQYHTNKTEQTTVYLSDEYCSAEK